MYQNVYIDAVFAANFLMDYILLRLTGFFIREGRNRCRCLMAAAGGALFSSISLCIPAEQIPRMWGIVEIFCAAGMLILAFIGSNLGSFTDFLCGWNNSACLSDPVMEKTCNGGSDILCACILERWDLDGSDGKYPNDRSDFCIVCVWNLSGNQSSDSNPGQRRTYTKRLLSGSA